MKKIFFSLLLVNFHLVHGQSPEWSSGSLVLTNDEVLVGHISVEEKHDLLLFHQDGLRVVYPAHKIKAAFFYDESANINRRFISIENENTVTTSYQLYEVVNSGKVTVLRRKKETAFANHQGALDYNYFTHYRNILSPLALFSKVVFPRLVEETDGLVKQFILQNHAKGNGATSSLRIIEFYNSMAATQAPIASKQERSR